MYGLIGKVKRLGQLSPGAMTAVLDTLQEMFDE
jgi:hypothetical protein